MDRLTATLLCLGALSLAPIAHAQQHDMSQHDMSQHAMHGNDDAMKAMFDKADANHDGSLTFEEMKAAHAAMGMGGHMPHMQHMQGQPMKDGKMGCCCCGEGGMQACAMGAKADPVGEAMSDK